MGRLARALEDMVARGASPEALREAMDWYKRPNFGELLDGWEARADTR
jgi:hypothetical protein